MSDEILKKMKGVRSKEKEKSFAKAVKTYKGLTALFPDKNEYWYGLGISLLRMGKNYDGFVALATAKRLGSEKALAKIMEIINDFEKVDKEKASKARFMLLGEGA